MRTRWLVLAALLAGCSQPIEQPIAFDHMAHAEAELDCDFCHEHYASSRFSGLPPLDTCTTCHDDEEDSESAVLRKLARFVASEEEIPWRRVYAMPEHVYYSHRRHVVIAGLACTECHGAIDTLRAPPSFPLVDQSMEWCIACHEERGASTDCIHCHM